MKKKVMPKGMKGKGAGMEMARRGPMPRVPMPGVRAPKKKKG